MSKKKTLSHKRKFPVRLNPKTPKVFRKVWMLDVRGAACPVEVEKQVRRLWRQHELDNNDILKTSLQALETKYIDWHQASDGGGTWIKGAPKTDLIVMYIREIEPKIKKNETIFIYWEG